METFTTKITDYGYDGEGVARFDGKVVFLPYALKDEIVEFVKTEDKSSFSRGKVTKVLHENENRVIPPCPYFGNCGGCTLQHAKYDYEIEIKKNLLAEQLQKVGYTGGIEVCKSPKEYGYRNKIHLFVGKDGLSLKRRASNSLVAIKKCLLVLDRINFAIEKIDTFIKSQKLENVYSDVYIRQEGQSLLVNFVLRKKTQINYQGIYLLLDGNCGIYETYKNVCLHKMGLQSLKINEMGLECEFSINSFHQINPYIMEKLYKEVMHNINGKTVLNCYSGAGVLSGIIAKRGFDVVGIELGKSEHCDAEKLKKDNELKNLTNICADCGESLTNFNDLVDTIIVDPPRGGMSKEVCDAVNNSLAQTLIYVSCNSATLVRDFARMESFSIQKVVLFDMFAKTGENETLCVCRKIGN